MQEDTEHQVLCPGNINWTKVYIFSIRDKNYILM